MKIECKNCKIEVEKEEMSRFLPIICKKCFLIPKNRDLYKVWMNKKLEKQSKQFPKKIQ